MSTRAETVAGRCAAGEIHTSRTTLWSDAPPRQPTTRSASIVCKHPPRSGPSEHLQRWRRAAVLTVVQGATHICSLPCTPLRRHALRLGPVMAQRLFATDSERPWTEQRVVPDIVIRAGGEPRRVGWGGIGRREAQRVEAAPERRSVCLPNRIRTRYLSRGGLHHEAPIGDRELEDRACGQGDLQPYLSQKACSVRSSASACRSCLRCGGRHGSESVG